MNYKDVYERIWREEVYRSVSPAEKIQDFIFMTLAENHGNKGWRGRSVLDWGCGTGRITREMQRCGYEALGIDVAANCLDVDVAPYLPLLVCNLFDFPTWIIADYSVCIDVLEHLDEAHVKQAVASICAATRRVAIIRVANFLENHGPDLVGEQLHICNKPADWWQELLGQYWHPSDVQRAWLNADQSPERYTFICGG